jgi:hypothetical protein
MDTVAAPNVENSTDGSETNSNEARIIVALERTEIGEHQSSGIELSADHTSNKAGRFRDHAVRSRCLCPIITIADFRKAR